jgi:hypothetical protein
MFRHEPSNEKLMKDVGKPIVDNKIRNFSAGTQENYGNAIHDNRICDQDFIRNELNANDEHFSIMRYSVWLRMAMKG